MRKIIHDSAKLNWLHAFLALGVAIVLIAAMTKLGANAADPSIWEEIAVVAHIRPPLAIFPGCWRWTVGWMFDWLGVDSAIYLLQILGKVAAGLVVIFAYLSIRMILEMLMRSDQQHAIWHRKLVPIFSVFGAFAFGMSEPFWQVSRLLSPESLRLLMFAVSLFLSLRWMTRGSMWRLLPLMAILGMMAAETPMAFILPVAFIYAYRLLWTQIVNGYFEKPSLLPTPSGLQKWRMLFVYLVSMAFTMWANAAEFSKLGGLEANGILADDIYFRYFGGYWRMIINSSSIVGWVLGIGCCVLPMVLAMKVSTRVLRDDVPMSFHFGVLMLLVGALGLMQSGAFPAARFWTYVKDMVMVRSGYLLSFFVLSAMVTMAVSFASFAFECQRTYLLEGDRKPRLALRALVPVVALAALALIGAHKFGGEHVAETEMMNVVNDAVREIVRECGDAKWLFTDGRLDAGVEIESRRQGGNLITMNMMSGASEWERTLRVRGLDPKSEDYRTAEIGVPALLRVWAGEKTNGMAGVAIQLGFEFWRRDRKPLPKQSGIVARQVGMSDEEQKRGKEITKAITDRIIAISPDVVDKCSSPALASAFSAVNWRISRFARLRDDEETANQLDELNGALKRMLSIIEQERLRTFMQLTPREGLLLALRRADFVEARRYSAAVLSNDEDDPEANFGMGMSSLMRKNYLDAEMYLKRCLKRRPDEPAVINNLSIVYRKLHRYDEAVKYAKRAIELLPNTPEVKRTLADALKKAP